MLSATMLITFHVRQIELAQRRSIAENYALKNNAEILQLLSISVANLDTAILSYNFSMFHNQELNREIKESLINNNFSDLRDKFSIRVYSYDSTHRLLFNNDSTQYGVIEASIKTQGQKTKATGLYYYENSPDLFSYIYKKEVYGADGVYNGAIFIVVDPKSNDQDELFSPLFRQVKNLSTDDNTNYSIAFYQGQRLIRTSNNGFDFADSISKDQIPKFTDTLISKNEYSQYWYNTGANKTIIVVKRSDWFLTAFTIFSYLFCLFIALVIFLHYSNLLFKTGFRWGNMQEVFSFNIRTQIQTTIISVSLFSFIVIGVITISFFIVSFNKDSSDKLVHRAYAIKSEIEEAEKLPAYKDTSVADNGPDFGAHLLHRINDIATMQNTDLNLYDRLGNLTASSQQFIFDNHILTEKMQPKAYYTMHFDHSTQYIQNEQIGNITYLSIYVAVRDAKGNVKAYLNIPSLNSQNELKQEINNFLVTLININALIFIFAGGIAILVTSRITSSFTLIGSKMKEISLGRINEEIAWKGKDEIGALVNEYNKMVRKLEQSAQALARSEREGAWREMARQVAHEIKNPLTPMKLSIQYLQRAVNNNASNVKELSQQVAHTLIEQIEQLSKIAGDFSQFANIGNVSMEDFDVSEVIASLINLFSADSSLQLIWDKEDGANIIKADRVQINRLFTNLIKNAIEASDNNGVVLIKVQQYVKGNHVIIAIADKGSGIPVEMRQKIFIPNFTTKSSGTGLGLAICHGIVEKANGAIWFETEQGHGTTFYVSLPLVKGA
jgi:signal transduction histidine kinase